MRIFLLLCFSAIFSLDGFSQNCGDKDINGDELSVDCGGTMCPECLPLLHRIECEDGVGESGVYELYVYLPSYLWTDDTLEEYYYQFGGDLNIECYTLNECQGFTNYLDGNIANISIYKKIIPEQTVIGYGFLTVSLDCVRAVEYSCIDSLNSNLSATYEKIELENSDSYMLKILFEDGTPPFSIMDNDTDSLFYKIKHPDRSPYYLGAIPNDVDLDLTVIDRYNCSAPILNIADTTMPIDTMDIVDTIGTGFSFNHFNCGGNDFRVFPTFHTNNVNLQFCLASESQVSIFAYDVNGQYLDIVMEDQFLEVGTHQVPFYTGGFPLGMYFYVMEIGGKYTQVVRAVKL